MKKIILLIFLLFLIIPIHAQEIVPSAKSAYLIEYTTGKVLYDKNSEEKCYPASMTKMMSLILVYEALNRNELSFNDMVTISENAASMGGSQIYLQPNEQMSVEDLLKSICIASANDAMVALSEYISGSVSSFVSQMNEKAKELSLINTHFENTTGLHDENHYSSAKDMAIIAQKLIEVGGEHLLTHTSTYDAYIREDTENPFWLVNTNKLIKSYDYVDGLKTGFTQEALSCITVTANKENVRLIGVVMKEPDSKTRNKEIMEMINVGFSQIEYQLFFKQNEIYSDYTFEFGKPQDNYLIYLEDVGTITQKNTSLEITNQEFIQTNFDLPIEQNEKIGELTITFNNQDKITIDIGIKEKVAKMDFFDYFKMVFWNLLT